MIKLGDYNTLRIIRFTDHGAYLDGGEVGEILLPKAYVEREMRPDDEVTAFVCLDQQERLVATLETPLARVGDFAFLRVAWTNEHGAFLDWGLFHHHNSFHSSWVALNRLLKQRNAALSQNQPYSAIKIWDIELAKLAHQVSYWRAEYAEALRPEIEKTCQLFLPELEISVSFHQGWEKETEYGELLAQNFERDKVIGYTVSGPQKADFRFKANGLPVEDVLSRGQLKLLMCALRLAQGEHLMIQKQRHCIFLIDDFASELDQHKRALLAERLQQSGSQVFVTAITQGQLKEMQVGKGKLFQVDTGKITELQS